MSYTKEIDVLGETYKFIELEWDEFKDRAEEIYPFYDENDIHNVGFCSRNKEIVICDLLTHPYWKRLLGLKIITCGKGKRGREREKKRLGNA